MVKRIIHNMVLGQWLSMVSKIDPMDNQMESHMQMPHAQKHSHWQLNEQKVKNTLDSNPFHITGVITSTLKTKLAGSSSTNRINKNIFRQQQHVEILKKEKERQVFRSQATKIWRTTSSTDQTSRYRVGRWGSDWDWNGAYGTRLIVPEGSLLVKPESRPKSDLLNP